MKYKYKLIMLMVYIIIYNYINKRIVINLIQLQRNEKTKEKSIKVALCTMGKNENLYVKEFIEYYLKLGIDHIYIYDDNLPNTEKISDVLRNNYSKKVTVNNVNSSNIKSQSDAFTKCYQNNLRKYDWFLMFDMDEYLYIVKDSLKGFLLKSVYNKCDFIVFHWVLAKDNGLVYYDNRSLFKRFKPPYVSSGQVKTIIRGNITDLKYGVHSPSFSPKRNFTCNNEGKRIYIEKLNFIFLKPTNINKAYLIHFKFKSTEEMIKKLKRGWIYSQYNLMKYRLINLFTYFKLNDITNEKIKYIQNNLKIDFS